MPCHDMDYWREMVAEMVAEDRAARDYRNWQEAHANPNDPDHENEPEDEA
jgi:hypothetical protein